MARFVVTGTPRTATGYASKFFKALKMPCTHEQVFRPLGTLEDVLDWYEHGDSGESSWLAWAFLGLLPGPVPVLHTTRNPWAIVDSLAHRNDMIPREATSDPRKKKYRDAIVAYCPDVVAYEDDVNRAAAFVLQWNKRITSTVALNGCPYLRYRAEGMEACQVKEMLEFVGEYRDTFEIDDALRNVPQNVNAGKRLHFNIEVTTPQVREAMQKIWPDREPVIDVLKTEEPRRARDELEQVMEPCLRDALRRLASEQGYLDDQGAEVTFKQGVQNGARQQSTPV